MHIKHAIYAKQLHREGTRRPAVLLSRQIDWSDAKSTVTTWCASIALLGLIATSLFGTLGAVLFIAATLALISLRPLEAAGYLLKYLPLLLLPALACASTLWSDAPQRTLRASLQLTITFIAAIVICRSMKPSTMLRVLFIGFAVTALLLAPGVPYALKNHSPLGGSWLGSKNQVGFAAQALISLSLLIAIDNEQPLVARWCSIPAVALALTILALSQSAGAAVSLAITLLTFPPLAMLGYVRLRVRTVLLIFLLVAVALGLVFFPDLQNAWTDFRLNVLKKDATLTGRTYLWDIAARLIAERPLLGQGYNAFWRQGNIDAEGLWRWGGIAERSGFNFHNAYLEMRVDLGSVGEGMFIAYCVIIAAAGFARQLFRPYLHMAFFLSFAIVLYARGFEESGVVAPFSAATVMWLATAIYAWGISPNANPALVIQRSVSDDRPAAAAVSGDVRKSSKNIGSRSLRVSALRSKSSSYKSRR